MVRTKHNSLRKIPMGMSPKIAATKCTSRTSVVESASSASSPSCSSKSKYSGGGNPIHPRPIPVWQKSIKCFFNVLENRNEDGSVPMADDETSILYEGENIPGPFMKDDNENDDEDYENIPTSSSSIDFMNTPGPSSTVTYDQKYSKIASRNIILKN